MPWIPLSRRRGPSGTMTGHDPSTDCGRLLAGCDVQMKAVAIIPARLAATRLPDKPLARIQGRTMVEWVYLRATAARSIDRVLVATPDAAIADAVRSFGGNVVMTRADHLTGTDRISEAADTLNQEYSVVVNVQGDEPRVAPEVIDAVAETLLRDRSLAMATVCCPLPPARENDPNVVKVVVDASDHALYFSRSPIPYRRSTDSDYAPLQHVGLYGYRRDFLEDFPKMDRTPLERIESLEQLRVLEHGYRIKLVRTLHAPESVDTPEDLERVRQLFDMESAVSA